MSCSCCAQVTATVSLASRDDDAWHVRLQAAGLPVTEIADQPWGMHELALTDPSGNHVRIGRPVAGAG